MITLFLSSFIMFCLVILLTVRRHRKLEEKYRQNFWEREREANSTRKKSLENLEYITIPFDRLPVNTLKDNAAVCEYLHLLADLSEQKIVNLTGLSNTDLKLLYGAANIGSLSEYDQNYTLLARTLQSWAELLYKNGFLQDALTVLEFAVSTRTDVSHSYYLLADIYDGLGEREKKELLAERAASLNSTTKNIIVRTLQGAGPYSGWLHSV